MQFKFRQFPTWVTQHTVCTANTEPEHNEPRKRPECEFSITRIAVRQSEGRATKWHDCVHDRPDRQRQRRHKHRTSRHPWLTNTERLACVCVLTESLACVCAHWEPCVWVCAHWEPCVCVCAHQNWIAILDAKHVSSNTPTERNEKNGFKIGGENLSSWEKHMHALCRIYTLQKIICLLYWKECTYHVEYTHCKTKKTYYTGRNARIM